MLKSRKITCPKCGAMIEVGNPNNLAVRDITCPNPNCKVLLHVNFDDGETILADNNEQKNIPGKLQYNGHAPLELKEGKQTIGRADSKHTADLGIEVDDHAMSRLHCLIEVIKLASGKVKAIISDIRDDEKIKIRPTIVDNNPLCKMDRIVLDDGDYVKMGDTMIKYVQE